MFIHPPHVHITLSPRTNPDPDPTIIVGELGIQRAMTTGTHGIGVKTPRAAVVAAAVVGFAKEEHAPKDIIFVKGTKSITFAMERPQTRTLFTGETINEDGETPKEHIHLAPFTHLQDIKNDTLLQV